jgi:hypothetical protein
VDEAVNIILGNGLGNPLGTFNMYVFEREVPSSVSPAGLAQLADHLNSLRRIVSADQVVHDVRMPDALFD